MEFPASVTNDKWLEGNGYVGFLLRHPDITLKKARNLSIAQAMGANPTVIGNWLKLLKDVEDTAGIISPDQIWSGDENRHTKCTEGGEGVRNETHQNIPAGLLGARRDFNHFIVR